MAKDFFFPPTVGLSSSNISLSLDKTLNTEEELKNMILSSVRETASANGDLHTSQTIANTFQKGTTVLLNLL